LLIASDAKLIIASSRGERSVSLQDFYTGNGKTPFHLSQNELVVEVQIPKRVEGTRAFYLKHRFRDAVDFPIVGVALSGVRGQEIGFKEIKVVAGGATPAPIRCLKAEEIIRNEKITDPVLEEAGEVAAKEVPIVSSSLCPASYRKTLVRQLVIRGARMFSGRARGGLQSE
jgi:carbon-monoxide dehydrogenase medium subunit